MAVIGEIVASPQVDASGESQKEQKPLKSKKQEE